MKYFKFSTPLFLYLAFFSFFIIGEYVFRLGQGKLPGGTELWLSDLILSNAISASVFIIWLIANRWSKSRPSSRSNLLTTFSERSIKRIKQNTIASILLLLLIGILSVGNPLLNPLGFRQAIQGGGAAYFLVYFIFMEKVFGIYYFNQLYTKRVTRKDTLLAVTIVGFALITGFASLFVYFFIYGLLFLNAKYNVRVVGFWVILLFTFLIVLTPIYTLVRENLMFGGDDLGAVVNLFFEKIGANFFDVIYDRFDYFDLQVAGASVARKFSDITYSFNALTQFVPRSIWAEKPPTYSLLMTGLYAPELLDIGVTINFGYVNEFVLYFGDAGPVVSGLFFGAMLTLSYSMLKRPHDTKAILFYAVILHGYMLAFVGGGYINDMPFAQLVIGLILYRAIGLHKSTHDDPAPSPAQPLQVAPC